MKRFRLRAVMRFARLLGVPVQVESKYFGQFSRPKNNQPRDAGAEGVKHET